MTDADKVFVALQVLNGFIDAVEFLEHENWWRAPTDKSIRSDAFKALVDHVTNNLKPNEFGVPGQPGDYIWIDELIK